MIKFKAKTWLDVKGVVKATQQASLPRIKQCAALVEREAKILLSVGGGATHEPSTAPLPPHLQTGVLRSSIQYAPTAYGTYLVGPSKSQAWYGAVQEFGSAKGKIPKRPFMRPALAAVAPKFKDLFKKLPLADTPAGRKMNSDTEMKMKKGKSSNQ